MSNLSRLKTAESVSPKHPDKLCDQISDAILDAYLRGDPASRVAVEAVGGHGKVFITGEVTSSADVDIEPIILRIAGQIETEVRIAQQSHEIASGVDTGGAGDQGIMVGYACSETSERLPLEVVLARSLNQSLYAIWPHDGKTQVTINEANEIVALVASFQHAPHDDLQAAVEDWRRTQANVEANRDARLHINPAGDWSVGGFDADAGLTGRKLVVDNYGPRIPIGGGCYSGKDPSKVDRSAAYMSRFIAKEYLQRYQAAEAYVYLAYAIGYDQPVEATAIVDGRSQRVDDYDLTPNGIIDRLDLRRPIYEPTARYGHYGHDEFSWEAGTV